MNSKAVKTDWAHILKDEKGFRSFLQLARSEGVRAITVGGITIQFQETKFVTPGELKPEPAPQLSEEEKRRKEEEDLYWSAG